MRSFSDLSDERLGLPVDLPLLAEVRVPTTAVAPEEVEQAGPAAGGMLAAAGAGAAAPPVGQAAAWGVSTTCLPSVSCEVPTTVVQPS